MVKRKLLAVFLQANSRQLIANGFPSIRPAREELQHGGVEVGGALDLRDVAGVVEDDELRAGDLATGTSKSQLHKARMRLRKLLGATRAGKRTAA